MYIFWRIYTLSTRTYTCDKINGSQLHYQPFDVLQYAHYSTTRDYTSPKLHSIVCILVVCECEGSSKHLTGLVSLVPDELLLNAAIGVLFVCSSGRREHPTKTCKRNIEAKRLRGRMIHKGRYTKSVCRRQLEEGRREKQKNGCQSNRTGANYLWKKQLGCSMALSGVFEFILFWWCRAAAYLYGSLWGSDKNQ